MKQTEDSHTVSQSATPGATTTGGRFVAVLMNVCRLLLAVVFIFSGFVKAVDPLGTQYKLTDYLRAMHLGGLLPEMAVLVFSVALAVLEFCLGIFLLFAIRRRFTSKAVLALMLIMTPLTLWLALANPISDCGCFGDAVVLSNWQTFWKNVVLLAAAIVVACWPQKMFRFVSESNQWIVINYSALFVLLLSAYCLYDLPIFDFRPYRIGTDLRQGWMHMMDGEESPYADFFIEPVDDYEGDLTYDVLNDTGYTFLLVSSHLEKADDSHFSRINEIYEYCQQHDYPFYCITASGDKAISRWQDQTGADYPFCQADDIVLKTIVRSNPGLLLLHDGKIEGKWSHNRLPDIDETAAGQPLEQLPIGHATERTVASRIVFLLLCFVLPLALLTIADRTWMWTKWMRRKKLTAHDGQ